MTEAKKLELTTKLDNLVSEYCACENEKRAYYTAHLRDKSRTTIRTLYLKQEYIDTLLKRIVMIVERLMAKDVEITNELAIMIFDEYEKQIVAGDFLL